MIKVALATLLLSAVALSSPIATDSEEYVTSKFQDFIHKHGKVYSAYEYPKRLAAFTSNLRKIEYINTANLARKEGAVHGVNQFADLTEEEFKKTYLSGFIPDMVKNAPMLDEVVEKVNNLKVDAIPTEWDWTTQGAVTHVKNQGQCGSCWSFSATGNMEGQNFLVNKKLVSLSEEQLVDCDTVDQGCNGGLPSNAYQYVMKTGGLDTEASYPYTAGGGSGGSCAYNPANSAITVKSWSALPTDETKLAAWLYTYGPISIGINAGWMQTYSHGVANPLICPASGIDHGVLIVGYGTEKGVFGTTPFWKIKNSWGESWGEQGYCRIVRGKAKCGLNTMCTSAVVNAATEAQQKIQARDAIMA